MESANGMGLPVAGSGWGDRRAPCAAPGAPGERSVLFDALQFIGVFADGEDVVGVEVLEELDGAAGPADLE